MVEITTSEPITVSMQSLLKRELRCSDNDFVALSACLLVPLLESDEGISRDLVFTVHVSPVAGAGGVGGWWWCTTAPPPATRQSEKEYRSSHTNPLTN